MEITGKVKSKSGDIQVSPTFRKSELVVSTDEQYPQHIMIEFPQDKCDLIDRVQVGDEVKVHINLRGREWTSPTGEVKHFNSIHGWRVERLGAGTPQPQAQTFAAVPQFTNDEVDDLPF